MGLGAEAALAAAGAGAVDITDAIGAEPPLCAAFAERGAAKLAFGAELGGAGAQATTHHAAPTQTFPAFTSASVPCPYPAA